MLDCPLSLLQIIAKAESCKTSATRVPPGELSILIAFGCWVKIRWQGSRLAVICQDKESEVSNSSHTWQLLELIQGTVLLSWTYIRPDGQLHS